jgi:hypothetical protein
MLAVTVLIVVLGICATVVSVSDARAGGGRPGDGGDPGRVEVNADGQPARSSSRRS